MLILGTTVGIAMAAYKLALPRPGTGALISDGAVARVNGQAVQRQDYLRMLNALASDRRNPIDEQERRRVLERLVDEELLFQRGMELGLARSDPRIRAQITRAVITSAVAAAQGKQPGEAELRHFYERNRDFFTRTGDLRVRQIFVRTKAVKDPAAESRAAQAAARLRAGEDFSAVRDELGDPELAPLPDALLPPAKLREYLGPTALRTVLNLPLGEVSDPVRSGTGYHVLQVLERVPGTTPPFSEIRAEVAAEFRRRQSEEALRQYLDDLRARAEIEIAPQLP